MTCSCMEARVTLPFMRYTWGAPTQVEHPTYRRMAAQARITLSLEGYAEQCWRQMDTEKWGPTSRALSVPHQLRLGVRQLCHHLKLEWSDIKRYLSSRFVALRDTWAQVLAGLPQHRIQGHSATPDPVGGPRQPLAALPGT